MTKSTIVWLVMTLCALAVAGYAMSLPLLAPELRPPFVRSLLADRPIAVSAHLIGGGIALIAGAFQLNAGLRARIIVAHRWLGRVYVLAVVVAGMAGLALALQAFGGLIAHTGFGSLAVCWLAATLNAYRLVRQGNIAGHRSWMIRSYALTLAAVTLRLYLPLSQMADLSMTVAYPAIAWLCWVPNALIAEWIVRSMRSVTALPAN